MPALSMDSLTLHWYSQSGDITILAVTSQYLRWHHNTCCDITILALILQCLLWYHTKCTYHDITILAVTHHIRSKLVHKIINFRSWCALNSSSKWLIIYSWMNEIVFNTWAKCIYNKLYLLWRGGEPPPTLSRSFSVGDYYIFNISLETVRRSTG